MNLIVQETPGQPPEPSGVLWHELERRKSVLKGVMRDGSPLQGTPSPELGWLVVDGAEVCQLTPLDHFFAINEAFSVLGLPAPAPDPQQPFAWAEQTYKSGSSSFRVESMDW